MKKLLTPRFSPILLVVLCVGCGAGDYRALLDNSLKDIAASNPFQHMQERAELPGTSLTFRVPAAMGAGEMSATPMTGGAELSPAVKAPFNIPHLALTYQGHLTDGTGGKYTFYCYLAGMVMEKASGKPGNRMRVNIANAFALLNLQYHDVQCARENGTGADWQLLEVTDDQMFLYIDKDGKETNRKMEGKVVCYSRREGDTHVIVIWRVPTSILGKEGGINFEKWGKMVPGSVEPGAK